MKREIRDSEYAALAELRYRIRQFLRGSDLAAEGAGLEPQQYQMLLTIRAVANPTKPASDDWRSAWRCVTTVLLA